MRALVLALAASSLALAGCGKKEATGNTSAVDAALSADDFATSDVTAIDAATGADANMAADVEFNLIDNAGGEDGDRPASGTAPRRPRASTTSNDSADGNQAAPEPADEPAETNTL
jgi:hypothetical protein